MIVTSDFEEIENLCSRALVFVRGTFRAELEGERVTVAAMSTAFAGDGAPSHLPAIAGAGP